MTAPSPEITAVAFDLMDTLLHDPYREALAAAFGDRSRAAFAGRDRTTWPRFETGELTEAEFWEAHAAWSPDVAAFDHLRRDRTTWLDGMRELLVEVREAGPRVVIATNYPSWIDDIEQRILDGLVDEIVASCRVGVRKPDGRFYDAVGVAAQSTHDEVLFVDDRQENVDAALAAGMQAVTFRSADALRRDLVELGVL